MPMIECSELRLSAGGRQLLANAELALPAASLTALLGRNGCGKSTLLRALSGLDSDYQGQITVAGQDVRRMSPGALARNISLVTTRRPRLDKFTCRELVALGRSPYTDWTGALSADDYSIVDMWLERVGMADYAARWFDSLSDGEAQRVMIARALTQETPVVMLDEPTSFLDLPNRYLLVELLSRLAHDSGKCILYSTHELEIALRRSDYLCVFDQQKLCVRDASDTGVQGYLYGVFGLDM